MKRKEKIVFILTSPDEIWEDVNPNSHQVLTDEISKTIFPPKQEVSIGEIVWREQLKSSGIIKEK